MDTLFVCPFLLVNGKCYLDETMNTVCNAENKQHICDEGLRKLREQHKDGEQE